MSEEEKPVHLTTQEARAGATPHMTRYILVISLVLIIVIFGALLLYERV